MRQRKCKATNDRVVLYLGVHIASNHERMVIKLPPAAEEGVHIRDDLLVGQQVAEGVAEGALPSQHAPELIIRGGLVAVVTLVPVGVKGDVQLVYLARREKTWHTVRLVKHRLSVRAEGCTRAQLRSAPAGGAKEAELYAREEALKVPPVTNPKGDTLKFGGF
jgi:hypothetical protein